MNVAVFFGRLKSSVDETVAVFEMLVAAMSAVPAIVTVAVAPAASVPS